MTSYLNTINSEGTTLNLNDTSGYGVVVGNSLTSILGSRTFGETTMGAITGSSATFSSTVTSTGLLTASNGLTSTAGPTTLGLTTIGSITSTSATFSTTLGVTGLATFGAGGLTSTAGTTTLGATTIGVISGTSASFSSTVISTGLLTASNGLTSTAGTTTLGLTTIGALTGTSASFSTTLNTAGLATFGAGGLTSTAGTTTLGLTTIGAITGTSASFSTTLNTAGLATFGAGGLISTEGTTTLGTTTIGAITGTSATFSTTVTSIGLLTASNGLISTTGTTTLGLTTIGAITGTSATFSSTVTISGILTASNGLTSTSGVTTLGETTVGPITGTSATFTNQINSTLNNGTPPFVVASSTNVLNLNASSLNGSTFQSPGSIGSNTAGPGVFTTLTANTSLNSTSGTTLLGTTTLSGEMSMGNNKITGLANPTNTNDATTKGYVDSISAGTSAKTSVIVATTVPGILATSFKNDDVIDGVNLVTGYRILIKDQTNQIENGVYIVNASGPPSRASDFGIGYTAAGTFVFIQEGTINDNAGFICNSSSGSDIVGTNNIIFSQFTGAAQVIAGTGLTKSGNILSVDASQTQISSVGTLSSLSVSGALSGSSQTLSSTLSVTGITSLRDLNLIGSNSGIVSFKTQANSGTYNYNVPTSSGSPGEILTSGGGELSPMTWTPVTGTGNIVLSNSPILGTTTIGDITGTSAYFSDSTSSTSKTNGALTVVGGISTQENLNVGGYIGITGLTSGTISIKSQATTTTYNYNLPTTAGTAGQILTSAGGDGAPMTWENQTAGTISSINLSVPYFLSVSGSPMTASGTFTIGLSGTAILVENGGTGATTFTSNSVLLGNGTSAIQSGSNISYFTDTLTLPKIILNDTTSSTSNSTGSVLLSGGLALSNTTDAVSSTNGGSITSAGGLAVAKKLFVGTSADISSTVSTSGVLARGTTSGTVSILPQANAGTFNFNLPITAGVSGQVLTSTGGGSSAMSWTTPPLNSVPQTFNTTGLQSQVIPENVTGLSYSFGSFDISMTVEIVATTSLTQIFKLTGILSPSSGWSITSISVSGDESLVDFTISAGGNIQYTSATYAGFTSLTFTWAQFSNTQGIGYLALAGSGSGVVTIAPQPITETYNYNLPTTSGTIGQVLISSGGGSLPMTWGEPWADTTTFNAVNNQISAANVTGLLYSTGCFEINILVTLVATVNLNEFFKILGVKKGNNTYDMVIISQSGDTSGVIFTINSSGQVQYTSANSAGFVSLTFKWMEIGENFS